MLPPFIYDESTFEKNKIQINLLEIASVDVIYAFESPNPGFFLMMNAPNKV
jgi:hypothetical protein